MLVWSRLRVRARFPTSTAFRCLAAQDQFLTAIERSRAPVLARSSKLKMFRPRVQGGLATLVWSRLLVGPDFQRQRHSDPLLLIIVPLNVL